MKSLKSKFIFCFIGILIALSSKSMYAQDYSFGLKAGLNYSLGNDGSEIAGSLGQFSAESDFGYLLGGFSEFGYKGFFVRPEIFFAHVSSEFNINDTSLEYSFKKINIPILLGYNVYGPIDIYVGPSYQKITDAYLEDVKGKQIDLDQSNFNLHFGLKFIYVDWELDIRYEYSPSVDSNQRVDLKNLMDDAYFDDGRLNNIMLSLNYKIFDSETYTAKDVVDQ